MNDLTLAEYRALAELRYQLRCFLRFSEDAARNAGLEPRQHQLLLAVKGLPADSRPTIGVLAERLQIKPHTAVELVNRLAKGGYVERRQGASEDRRKVVVKLNVKGQAVLRELTLFHKAELQSDGPTLINALEGVLHTGRNKKKPSGT
jgi:DNA-binding MarR family transcriptional regulator